MLLFEFFHLLSLKPHLKLYTFKLLWSLLKSIYKYFLSSLSSSRTLKAFRKISRTPSRQLWNTHTGQTDNLSPRAPILSHRRQTKWCKLSQKSLLGHQKAKIETYFSYKGCCNDESKTLNALNTTKLAAKTCSERVCFYSEELVHSTWIAHKVWGKKEEHFYTEIS